MKRWNNLQQCREEADLTIKQLASLMERAAEEGRIAKSVSERHIRRLEHGDPHPVRDETWEAFSVVLNVSVEKLTGPRGKDAPSAASTLKAAAAAVLKDENPMTVAALEAALAGLRSSVDGSKTRQAKAPRATRRPRPPAKRRKPAASDSDAPRES